VVAKRTLTDLDIAQLHEDFWKNRIQVDAPIVFTPVSEVLLEQVEIKKKSKRAPTFLTRVYNELFLQQDDWTYGVADKQRIFKFLMMNLGQSVKNLDKYIVTRMVNGLQNALVADKKQMYEHWWSECFPNEPSLDMSDKNQDLISIQGTY
jgi:hypothetical protein